jgi:serine/threonine protein kinase
MQDDQTAQGTRFQGTAGFMAPEMIVTSLHGPPYAIDIWSLGSITYYMLTNRLVLCELADLYSYGVGNQDGLLCDYTGSNVTLDAKDFIAKLLARSPQARLTASDALSSQWIAGLARYSLL